jgi:hypothetical protein
MDLHQDTVDEFYTGHGGADAVARPIVASNMARKAYKYVRVRATDGNTIGIYVGPSTVSTSTGYLLYETNEVEVPIEDPSDVYVVATPAGNSSQVVTVAGSAGDTFTLTFDGQTTTDIAYDAAASAVDSALEALSTIGTGNVTVTGSDGGPFTVEFDGDFEKTDVPLMIGVGSDAGCTVSIVKTDASAGSLYSWMSV